MCNTFNALIMSVSVCVDPNAVGLSVMGDFLNYATYTQRKVLRCGRCVRCVK